MTQTITLTNNGHFFAVRGEYNISLISFNILGNFGNGKLVASTTEQNDLTRAVPFRDGNGTQIELTQETQYGISSSSKYRWYIFTLQNSTGASIDIDYVGIITDNIKTNVV